VLAIVISRAGEPTRRRTYAATDVTIGHHHGCQLVLDADSADAAHARVVRDGKVVLVDLRSAAGTFVGGRRLASPMVVQPADRIAIGAYTLAAFVVTPESLDPTTLPVRDPVERDLLDAIAAGDEASRLVYADWLEGIGDHPRAELLRLQHALDAITPEDPRFERWTDRLREVASGIDLAWRSRVAKRAIEGCPAFDFQCPRRWEALAPTAREGVRHCNACKHEVFYCASVEEAREHAAGGRCVALDVTSARWTDDLAPPFGVHVCGACAIDVGPGLARCPHCGAPSGRATLRGRMVR
jgi:uncharacterized protein (TIGR02996 family)